MLMYSLSRQLLSDVDNLPPRSFIESLRIEYFDWKRPQEQDIQQYSDEFKEHTIEHVKDLKTITSDTIASLVILNEGLKDLGGNARDSTARVSREKDELVSSFPINAQSDVTNQVWIERRYVWYALECRRNQEEGGCLAYP